MANVIRLKRASGSDPSASDLVSGEPAVRTDTGELFFKKDDGSIAKVAGAGGGPDFKYLALRNAANNGAASFPNADFTLVRSGTTTALTPTAANTLLVSVNGVIQKPNTGTSTPSEGFALSGSTIKFGANISAAPDFILYQESGGIGEPSDDTVSEVKLKVSNSPINGYFLSAQSGNNGGLTWAAPVATSCTGNSATATALATARTINGTSFDGTANITVTAAAGTLTGTTLNSSVTASSLTSLGDLTSLTVTGNLVTNGNITVGNNNSIFAENNLRFKSSGDAFIDHNTVGQDINFRVSGSNSNDTNALTVKSTGNVDFHNGIDVTGAITATGNLSITSAAPQIFLTDSNANSDYAIVVNTGQFRIRDETNSANRLAVNSDGHVDIYNRLDAQGGLEITGVTTTTGRVNIGDTQMSQNLLNVEDGTAAAIDIASHGSGGDTAYIGVKKSTGGGLTLGISNRDIIFKTGATYNNGTTFDSGTEALRIHANRRVSIGTDSADASLHIKSPDGGNSRLILEQTQDAANYQNGIDFKNNGTQYAGITAGKDSSNNSLGLVFHTGASFTEQLRITSGGNVGIGTSNPAVKFVVSNGGAEGLEISHSSGTVDLNAYNRSTSARSPVGIVGQTFTVATGNPSLNTGLFQNSSGNVGIGTTSLSEKLTLNGNLLLEGGSNHAYPFIRLHSSAANVRKWTIYNGQPWNPDALIFYDTDEDNTTLTIETNKLGINRGANSITKTLEVGGNAEIMGFLNVTTGIHIPDGGDNDNSITIGSSNDFRLFHDGSNSFIKDGGTGSLKILSNQVQIINAANSENIANFNQDGAVQLFYDNDIRYTTQNGYGIHYGHFSSNANGSHDLGFSGSRWRNLYLSGSVTSSDKNEKNTITKSDLGLDFIKKLNPVSFKWNRETLDDKTHYGLIAQEVEETILSMGKKLEDFGAVDKPTTQEEGKDYAVTKDESTNMGLNYTELIAPLIKAIQELTARVEALEAG